MSTKNDDVQRLPPEGDHVCNGCGNLVWFRIVRTKPSKTRPGRMIAYLVCPICGQKATQMRVVHRPRKRRTYIYDD